MWSCVRWLRSPQPLTCRQIKKSVGFLPVGFLVALYGYFKLVAEYLKWWQCWKECWNIMWIYYAYVVSFCGTLFSDGRAALGVLHLILFHVLFLLHCTSYYLCVFTDPGSTSSSGIHRSSSSPTSPLSAGFPMAPVPAGSGGGRTAADPVDRNPVAIDMPLLSPQPSESADRRQVGQETEPETNLFSADQLTMVTAKRDGRPRFCNKCNTFKPDRSHHCSICEQCILKMDHHCPWINNCVGFRNQKFFFLFVFYGVLLAWFVLLSVFPVFLQIATQANHRRDQSTTPEQPLVFPAQLNLHWLFLMFSGFVFGVALLGFAGMHSHYIMTNKTSIEAFERNRYTVMNGSSLHRRHYVNIFHLGSWRANWVQVMGTRPAYWFLPIGNTPGDGQSFPVNPQAFQQLLEHATSANA